MHIKWVFLAINPHVASHKQNVEGKRVIMNYKLFKRTNNKHFWLNISDISDCTYQESVWRTFIHYIIFSLMKPFCPCYDNFNKIGSPRNILLCWIPWLTRQICFFYLPMNYKHSAVFQKRKHNIYVQCLFIIPLFTIPYSVVNSLKRNDAYMRHEWVQKWMRAYHLLNSDERTSIIKRKYSKCKKIISRTLILRKFSVKYVS